MGVKGESVIMDGASSPIRQVIVECDFAAVGGIDPGAIGQEFDIHFPPGKLVFVTWSTPSLSSA